MVGIGRAPSTIMHGGRTFVRRARVPIIPTRSTTLAPPPYFRFEAVGRRRAIPRWSAHAVPVSRKGWVYMDVGFPGARPVQGMGAAKEQCSINVLP